MDDYPDMVVEYVQKTKLKRNLWNELRNKIEEHKPDIIYAHSLGSIMCYEFFLLEVRVAILRTHGDGDTDPLTVKDERKMSLYKFKDPQNYNALTSRFNKIAKGHNSSAREILRKEVKGCATVKDCVDLVSKVSYIPPSKINVV